MAKKLTRSNRDKIIAGVSAGLGEYFQLDVVWVRIAFVLATFFGGSGLWIYIILWIAIPKNKITIFGNENLEDAGPVEGPLLKKESSGFNGNLIGGAILIVLGSYFLLQEFDLIPYWFSVFKLWPLVLVAIGLYIIFKSARKESHVPEATVENPAVEKTEEEEEQRNL